MIAALVGILSLVTCCSSDTKLRGSYDDLGRSEITVHTSGKRLRGRKSYGNPRQSKREEQGDPPRLRGGDGHGWHGALMVHSTTSGLEEIFCNSVDCPVDHMLVEGAEYVECEEGKCTEEQCCRATCSSFSCEDGFQIIPRAHTVGCDEEGCSEYHCCEKESEKFDRHKRPDERKPRHVLAMCSNFACATGSIPVVDSEAFECKDGTCDQQQCCVQIDKAPVPPGWNRRPEKPRKRTSTLSCAEYTCPMGYAPHSDFKTTWCFEGVCDTDQCCMKWTSDHSNPAIEPPASSSTAPVIVMCFEYTCPDGYMPHTDYDTTECFEGGCDVEQCCMEFDNSAAETRLMCSKYTCPEGYAPHAEYYTTECFDGACDVQQCCVSDDSNSALGAVVYSTPGPSPSLQPKHQYILDSCSNFECPPRHILVDNAHTLGCRHSVVDQSTSSYATGHGPFVYMDVGQEPSYEDEHLGSTASNRTLERNADDERWSDAEPINLFEEDDVKEWGDLSMDAMVWEERVIKRRLLGSSSGGVHVEGYELPCNPSTCCQKIDSEERRQLDLWGL